MSKTENKVDARKQELTVYLPDTRGVTISRWGCGNLKLGVDGVYTYSRLPGLGIGTCPGATQECERICYAMRVRDEPIWDVWARNSLALEGDEVLDEPLPSDAKIVRIHVSGDFDTPRYIQHWIKRVLEHPDVRFWAYTRSWRLSGLLPDLSRFRGLPNVQLFASMDKLTGFPPTGWRRAWLENDVRAQYPGGEGFHNPVSVDGEPIYVCPEETGRKANCQECGYCVRGQRGDVLFLVH